jgi:hypothetical protein
VVSRFVRRVRTASGAVAVQVVTRQGRHVLSVERLGSAHSDEVLALLVADAKDAGSRRGWPNLSLSSAPPDALDM